MTQITESAACGPANNGGSAGVDAGQPGHAAEPVPEAREEVVPDTPHGNVAEAQHDTAPAAPFHKEPAALPTVTLPDGEQVTPAHLLPLPSAQAMANLIAHKVGITASDGAVYRPPLTASRNRPASDKHFDFRSDPSPDDLTPPPFLRRTGRA